MFRCMHTMLNDPALQKRLVLVPQQFIVLWKNARLINHIGSTKNCPKVYNRHVRYWLLQGESWQHGPGFLIYPWCGQPEIQYDCKRLLSWGWVYAKLPFMLQSKQRYSHSSQSDIVMQFGLETGPGSEPSLDPTLAYAILESWQGPIWC